MTKLHDLHQLGQSIWYDNIRRALLDSGEMARLLEQGIRGVTSNPSIFEKAIGGSNDYDDALRALVEAGKSVDEIYEALVIEDIQRTADLLRPIYDESDGVDGYISLEVSPTLANETDGTIEQARRFFATVDRPNVMIKVPATPAGIPAIETLIGEGININVTLMFSLQQYEDVANAYIAGLEKLAADAGDLSKTASVASFFISRVDSKVDKALEGVGNTDLQGKIAIANAKVVYARSAEVYSGERWDKLAAAGARIQRLLWASTSTKNPAYPDTLYVDTLIGADTVNTVPPATLKAMLERATVAETLGQNVDEANAQLEALSAAGVNLDNITDELLTEGVDKFAQSFESLMQTIEEKRERLGHQHFTAQLGSYQESVDDALQDMHMNDVMNRIWNYDHTVWQPEPEEITNRLGWLHIAEAMQESVARLEALATETTQTAGYTHALLLGMGGSSLAPEVFRNTFGVADGYLDLAVLDSTDADYIHATAEKIDPAKTLFIVATKSGGTTETLSMFKFFYNKTVDAVGADSAGEHFVAITDPGSKLEKLAEDYKFRTTFLNDPNIGGRYSALSFFGLVPAALVGVDVARLLENSLIISHGCDACIPTGENPGAWLGAIMGELAKAGRDKVTFIASPQLENFGDWVEQLIAESTGKAGKGILPVVREPVGFPDVYSNDRLFVYLHLEGDNTHTTVVDALEQAGHPVVRLTLRDLYDIGGQFFLWEMATVVAGARMGIHPFNQPNVESAKVAAREMVTAYSESGQLPAQEAALEGDGITVYGKVSTDSPQAAFKAFIEQANAGDYVAFQAYIHPTEQSDELLESIRTQVRDNHKLATTVGYGPRFLHSTGQLHKGDGGNGLFVQFTSDPANDLDIPDEAGKPDSAMTFGVLKLAQALGDAQALKENNRRMIRFHLGTDAMGGLQKLLDSLA